MDRFSPNQVPTYHVEHLATFSTTTAQHEHVTPRMALQRLFKMEKTSGIWTQRMAIQLKANHMWILDGETNDVVERFPVAFIQQPTSFNDQNHIYNNILIFTVQLPNESQGELHIFQCVSHDAVNVVDDIYHWMRHYGVAIHNNNGNINSNGTNHRSTSPSNHLGNGMPDKSNNNNNDNHNPHSHHHAVAASPSSNVNVKEAVNAFNQIAAQREKKGASTDSIHRLPASGNAAVDIDSRSDSSSFAETSNNHHPHHHHPVNSSTSNNNSNNNNNNSSHRNHEMHETYSNERYVSILNHCFDDIERFIIRLQHAAAALRELQIRSHKRGAKGSGDGLLAIRARGPSEEEFFDILSKFKLAFNLLAKLKGCIHDPNAPELVHFLFTPLAIIIEAARGSEPPVDPSLVGIPYLSPDAIELLSNCCTSKEFDLWQSLGTTWIQPVKHIRMTSPFQPVFTDGWAPAITEPELLGIVTLADLEPDPDEMIAQTRPVQHLSPNNNKSRINHNHTFDDSDYEDQPNNNGDNSRIIAHSNHLPKTPKASVHRLTTNQSPSPVESIDRDSPTNTNGIDAEQLDWFAELQTRQAKIVRVLFPRTANNNKELTVIRGEILEVLDDSRKWWKARNSRGQVAHVPHTIVGEVESSHMIAMAGGPGDNGGGHHHPSTSMMMTNDDWIRRERQGAHDSLDYDIIINDNDRFNAEIDYHLHDPIMKQEEQWDYPYPDRDIQPLETQSLVSDTYTISQELSDLFNYGRSSSGIARMKGNQERENFLEIYSKKTEDNFSSKDLNDFLTFKEFPPYLIEFMETLFDIKEIHCKMFDWSKDELRKNVPVDVDDSMIQRLHSNLLILKNLVKPSRMNTLSLKLKHRKRDLIARYKEKNDQDELEKKAEETKAFTKDDENKDNHQMDKSEIKVEDHPSKPETENAEPITSH